MYRDELARMAHELGVGDRSAEDVLHEAYLLGAAIQGQATEVFRLATKDGALINKPRYYSSVKRFYETAANARRARQFGPEGTKVQGGRVVWEDVD